MASQQFEPPSGTRDFLAGELRVREHVFAAIRDVFERYGFEPLQTPAFERLETLTGKYGDEGDKLIFKILRRGEHEATGEADLALRYDMTVPLARVVAAHGSQLPVPYKRYVMGPVWRADRPGRGRFREFAQCDVDVVGSASPLADAEVVCAVADALRAVGVSDFSILVNSRRALAGLLGAYGVPAAGRRGRADHPGQAGQAGARRGGHASWLQARSLDPVTAKALVDDLTAPDAVDRLRRTLADAEEGREGLAEVDRLIAVAGAGDRRGADRLHAQPGPGTGLLHGGHLRGGGRGDARLHRQRRALRPPDRRARRPGRAGCGGSLGVERIIGLLSDEAVTAPRLDVAITVIDDDAAADAMDFAARLRRAGLRTEVYLGSSRKLARQLKWAADRRARYALIYGPQERSAGLVTVRDMDSGAQQQVPPDQLRPARRAPLTAGVVSRDGFPATSAHSAAAKTLPEVARSRSTPPSWRMRGHLARLGAVRAWLARGRGAGRRSACRRLPSAAAVIWPPPPLSPPPPLPLPPPFRRRRCRRRRCRRRRCRRRRSLRRRYRRRRYLRRRSN